MPATWQLLDAFVDEFNREGKVMYVTSPIVPISSEIYFSDTIDEAFYNGTSQIKKVTSDNCLFHEGDDAEYLYEVLEGVVRSSKVLIDGRRQVLSFGYPGDIIGLSHDSFYHSDCDAVSDVKLRVIHKNAYKEDLASDPEFCAKLLQNAVAEVNHMQEHFMMLGCKSAMEKLASFLIAIMDRQSEVKGPRKCFDLPMKRCDIADFLGLTIETISRNLTKLRKLGIIEMPSTQRVCVTKSSELRALAECDDEVGSD